MIGYRITMLVAMTSCSSDEDVTMGEDEVIQLCESPAHIQLTEEQKQMRNNNNEFAWRLFRTLQEADDHQGSTRDEITDALVLN